MNTSFEAIDKVREEMVSLAERLGTLMRGFVGSKADLETESAPEVEAEASLEAETAASAESVESNGKATKPSQSDLVRRYLKEHRDARNKDIIDLIKKDHGIDVAASLVSYLKGKTATKPAAKKRQLVKAGKTDKVVSASSLIREYLEKNPKASNDEVVRDVKRFNKVEIRPTLVSSVRAIMKRKSHKTSKVTVTKKLGTKKARKGLPMPALVVKVLEKAGKDGMKLREMTDKVIASGYEYHGSKGWEGIAQNVYQAVHALSKTVSHSGYEGKTAVILHDDASKRWKLNPKAVKKNVA